VLYEWIANGGLSASSASGVTQPDTNFPVFRIDTGAAAPTGAEELVVWDSTNLSNWNTGGYRIAQIAALVGSAQNLYLSQPWVATTQPATIVPASAAQKSICRCFGTWTDVSALSVDGEPMTITLVAVDNTDPTLIYNLSAVTLKNTETGLLIAERTVNLMLVAGQLQNVNQDSFVDLNRTDYISGTPTGTTLQYLMTCDSIGAPMSMTLLSAESPVISQPILFKLDTSTIGVTLGGTFDLSKKVA
jgi:hypothetical protein